MVKTIGRGKKKLQKFDRRCKEELNDEWSSLYYGDCDDYDTNNFVTHNDGFDKNINGPHFESGHLFWYLKGNLHREDGPAIEMLWGDKCWYKHNKRHRTDGPAEEYSNGNKKWYQNDNLHRIDGPAIEYIFGAKEWWVNGKRHRIDGPTTIHHNKYLYEFEICHKIIL